jgi:hypothetical protein
MVQSMLSDHPTINSRPTPRPKPTRSVGRGAIIRIAALHRTACAGGQNRLQRALPLTPFAAQQLAARRRATAVPRAALSTVLATLAPDMAHQALVVAKLFSAFVAVGTGLLAAAAWLDAKRKTQKPEVQYARTEVGAQGRSADGSTGSGGGEIGALRARCLRAVFAVAGRY